MSVSNAAQLMMRHINSKPCVPLPLNDLEVSFKKRSVMLKVLEMFDEKGWDVCFLIFL